MNSMNGPGTVVPMRTFRRSDTPRVSRCQEGVVVPLRAPDVLRESRTIVALPELMQTSTAVMGTSAMTFTRGAYWLPLFLSRLFVVGWSLLRAATSVVHGLDGEGVLAAGIAVGVGLSFLARDY